MGTDNAGGAQVWQYDGASWTNVSPPWAAANFLAPFMAVYGANLYAGTFNNGGAQVWQLSPTSVPTMNEWGMIVFALLAGIRSAYYLRRKRTPQA